jgi:Asp-tRNA(Asn)/Glu-tRNA(Gln) amidotransferase B subunit
VELKNLSSFNSVLKATEYEIKRQKSLVNSDQPVQRETRTFDSKSGQTVSIRSKEDQYDYRFMPEPNLLPLVVYPSKTFKPADSATICSNNRQLNFNEQFMKTVSKLKQECFIDLDKVKETFESKHLPQKRRDYLIENFGLKNETAFVFVANDLDKVLIEVAERKVETKRDQNRLKSVISVLTFEFLNQVNSNPGFEGIDFKLKCDKVDSYADLMSKGKLNNEVL